MSDATFIDDDGKVKLRVFFDGGTPPAESITKAVAGAAFIDNADNEVKVRIYADGSDIPPSSSNSVFNNESRSGNGTNHVSDVYQISSGSVTTLEVGLFLAITSSFPTPTPYTVANGTNVLTFSGGVVYDGSGTVCEVKDDQGETLIKIAIQVSASGLTVNYTCTTGTITITGGDMSVSHLHKTS